MSNAAILSNEASPLKTLLINTSEWSCFEYAVKSNAPNMMRNRIIVQGPTEPSFNRTEQFNIPRYGLWAGATLRYKLKIKGATATWAANKYNVRKFSNWLGAYMVENVLLQTHNKPIQELFPQTMVHEAVYGRDANYRQTMGALMAEDVQYLDDHSGRAHVAATVTPGVSSIPTKRNTVETAANDEGNGGSAIAAGTDLILDDAEILKGISGSTQVAAVEGRTGDLFVTVHLPLPICFMDSTSSFLDTSFVESLNLSVKLASHEKFMECHEVASSNEDGTGTITMTDKTATDNGVSLVKLDLLCDFITTSDATRKALQTANYKVDRPLTMLSWNSFKEMTRFETVTGGTGDGYTQKAQIVVPIKCNGLASHTLWRLIDITDHTSTSATYSKAASNPGVQLGPPVQDLTVERAADTETSTPKYIGPCWSNVTMKASGITLVDMEADDQLLGFGGGYARGLSSTAQGIKSFGKSAQSTFDGMNVICWGLDARSASSAYDSGSQSFKELVDCQLVVDLPSFYVGDGVQKKYAVEVFHKVYVLNTISSTDGRISQAISI